MSRPARHAAARTTAVAVAGALAGGCGVGVDVGFRSGIGFDDTLQEAGTRRVVSGVVGAGQTVLWVFRQLAPGRYVVALTGLDGDADLSPPTGSRCVRRSGPRGGTAPEDCLFESSGDAIIVPVVGRAAGSYVLSLSVAPAVATPRDEAAAVPAGSPVAGQVGPRGESRYAVRGIGVGSHAVAIVGLSADAALHVFTDDSFRIEQPCAASAARDALPSPEACVAGSPDGTLHFAVRDGASGAGASYLMLVVPAP